MEIRKKLISYLSNEVSLQEFEDWFVPETWEVEKTGNLDAAEWTNEIELKLEEFSKGHRTEDDLRAFFRNLLNTSAFSTGQAIQHRTSTSSTVSILPFVVQCAGIRYVRVS